MAGRLCIFVRDGGVSSPPEPLFKLTGASRYGWRYKSRAVTNAEVIL
jgi:hypothetical protein